MFQKIKSFFSSLFGKQPAKSRSLKDIDSLRGIHTGRAAEQTKFAIQLKEQYYNKPVHETYATGHVSGAAPIITDVSDYTSVQIRSLLDKERGNYYTGRIKTYWWTHRGVEYFNCLAEMVNFNEYNLLEHMWQGPQPNPGYHSARSLTMSIEGPNPKVKGLNFEPNT